MKNIKKINLNVKFINSKIKIIKKIIFILKTFYKIIYKFHIHNKKILFLGINNKLFNFFKSLKKTTKHLYLSNYNWINGVFSNFLIFKYVCLYKKNLFGLKSKNNINLIVILNKLLFKNEIIQANFLLISFYKNNINNKSYQFNSFKKVKLNLLFLLIYEILKLNI